MNLKLAEKTQSQNPRWALTVVAFHAAVESRSVDEIAQRSSIAELIEQIGERNVEGCLLNTGAARPNFAKLRKVSLNRGSHSESICCDLGLGNFRDCT